MNDAHLIVKKNTKNKILEIIQTYSIPLISGIFVALIFANMFPETYHLLVHHEFMHHQHWSSLHFIINDIFMVFFFGIAAKEIVESFLPGGALSPIKNAINPLFATIGGVVGPVAVFFMLTSFFGITHLNQGWGIPTATDIALAWLIARLIFGSGHPAINFLLLLAIVDDAIGLGIIAIFYGDPQNPVNVAYLLVTLFGMGLAFMFKKMHVSHWAPYVFICGSISWVGLYFAHLHPALALVCIVPFLPYKTKKNGKEIVDVHHSPLGIFEHTLKPYVDYGLFFFAFANAGVQLSSVSSLTATILLALIIGKTAGIFILSFIGKQLGFPLPQKMGYKHLFIVGIIAGTGLTVALFVSGVAYTDLALQGPAKMGALLSILAFPIAWIMKKILKIS